MDRGFHVTVKQDTEFGKEQAKRSRELAKKHIDAAKSFVIITVMEKTSNTGIVVTALRDGAVLQDMLNKAMGELPKHMLQMFKSMVEHKSKNDGMDVG